MVPRGSQDRSEEQKAAAEAEAEAAAEAEAEGGNPRRFTAEEQRMRGRRHSLAPGGRSDKNPLLGLLTAEDSIGCRVNLKVRWSQDGILGPDEVVNVHGENMEQRGRP
jgi:hypothetical protein